MVRQSNLILLLVRSIQEIHKIHTQKGLGVDSSLLPSVLVLYFTFFILVNYHHKPN